MNITRRSGAIAFFITLGALLVAGVTINSAWIVLHARTVAITFVGVLLFSALITGVVLNTVFLVREVRRNERQDSFINAVTHELKTPIASTRLYLETLLRLKVDEDQRQQFYRIMLADADRLLSTVDQVLKAGELSQKKRQQIRAIVDLEALVADCIAITRERHHLNAEAIQLAPVAGAVRVFGVAEDLRTAALNLLDNAVKYSPEGVHVRCSIETKHSASAKWAEFRVTDSGIGLPPNQSRRIFNRFYRVPGRSMLRIKGTGLGLFLVRSIARQHGGDATASSPGISKGTTITLTLPLANPATVPEAVATTSAG
ncbi:MAG: HAMP domain-containing histidine kinase [Acidobacteriaceae bacterium]|nr:HAMP domain-containing histidine kinase [Acidobacteriaceae bacterium]